MKRNSIIILAIILASCTSMNNDKEIESLKQSDIDFSNLSIEKGRNSAFISYCANNAVMLLPNSYPLNLHYSYLKN